MLVFLLIGEGATPAGTGFDGTALQRGLSQPVLEQHRQGPEALRLHVQGLAELCSALETGQGVSLEERRALGDRILARVAQAILLLRADRPGPTRTDKARWVVAHLAVDGHTNSVWEGPRPRDARPGCFGIRESVGQARGGASS